MDLDTEVEMEELQASQNFDFNTEWQTHLPRELDELKFKLEEAGRKCPKVAEIEYALEILKKIREKILELLKTTLAEITLKDLQTPWEKLGEGQFGHVYKTVFRGSHVAVKLFKTEAQIHLRESNLLRCISHENIIAYRGVGYIQSTEQEREIIPCDRSTYILRGEEEFWDSGVSTSSYRSCNDNSLEYPKMFFIMEYVEKNLHQYVIEKETHERHGLSLKRTWDIGKQLSGALSYLHSLGIAHRDLKPDNVLVSPSPLKLLVKLADFGLAQQDMNFKFTPFKYGSYFPGSYGSLVNIRWGPPEFKTMTTARTLDDSKMGDVYCLGLILLFTCSGLKPYADVGSDYLSSCDDIDETLSKKVACLSEGVLKQVLNSCITEKESRKTANEIYENYFYVENPYKELLLEGELFSCGFMRTEIYVADSCTSNDASQEGYYNISDILPSGYKHEDLKCLINLEDSVKERFPDDWELKSQYIQFYQEFKEQALQKKIDNNISVALKKIRLSRLYSIEGNQRIKLYFKQTDYVHHRTMRKIWMSLSNEEKVKEIPIKGEVHPFFSNSFGVHIAVLTNEGAGMQQKFIFSHRASKPGIPAPGAITCGAVESVTTPDIFESMSKSLFESDCEYGNINFYVDLVHTAVRGLREELGIDLSGNDIKSICLTTVYLKLDTHEWGLCGFVDLKDERIKEQNRLSAKKIRDIFTSGPKDKFAYESLTFIPFQLEEMVEFVSNNHEKFASSTKLVVVKVLQAFFGWSNVQHAFDR